ncbi:MAG: hypothetical protein AMXMBFR20_01610 [Planctomycetia bacterium]
MSGKPTPKPVQSFTECWKFGYKVVTSLFFVVTLSFRSPRAEFLPEEDVLSPGAIEQLCERLTIELTMKAAVWL